MAIACSVRPWRHHEVCGHHYRPHGRLLGFGDLSEGSQRKRGQESRPEFHANPPRSKGPCTAPFVRFTPLTIAYSYAGCEWVIERVRRIMAHSVVANLLRQFPPAGARCARIGWLKPASGRDQLRNVLPSAGPGVATFPGSAAIAPGGSAP